MYVNIYYIFCYTCIAYMINFKLINVVFTLAVLHACTCIHVYVMMINQRVQANFVE